MAWAIGIARHAGLRIEETTALTKTQLRDALRNGYVSLRVTKGGIARDVPLTGSARLLFREILSSSSDRGERIFVEHGRTHHQAFKSVQNWIYNHRELFQEKYVVDKEYGEQMRVDERPSLTYHGLRHAYAREQYEQRIRIGCPSMVARLEVAALLGHGRDDVTRVYTAK